MSVGSTFFYPIASTEFVHDFGVHSFTLRVFVYIIEEGGRPYICAEGNN